MAHAHIEYRGLNFYEKKWCQPTGEVPARGTFGECLICSGIYVVKIVEVLSLDLDSYWPYEKVLRWVRITKSAELREFKRAKKLAAKHG